MELKKTAAIPLFGTVILSVFVIGYLARTSKTADIKEDLRSLHEMASSQNYETLIRKVRSEPVSPKGFHFVVMGDSRDDETMSRRIFMQAALEKPAFILHTGDLIGYGTVREYLDYYYPLVKEIAPLPVIPVPGNHEAGPNEGFSAFMTIYGSDRYSFDYGGCRIVGINDNHADSLRAEDLRFLDQELSRPGTKTRFVVMHIPPAFVEEGMKKCPPDTRYRGFSRNAPALHELMKRHHVQGVFFGHDHGFASCNIDGVQYVISGGAGAELYENMCWIEAYYHYIVVHVTPNGVWEELVRRDNGRWVRSRWRDN